MNKPGFRRGSAGGGERAPDPVISGAPFSHAQILHLMKTEFARARRYAYPVSCVLIRVDRMQDLAERHGAELKATIRRELANLVSEKTRGHDHVGLIGDDAHMLVLPHTDGAGAQVVADRICESFRSIDVVVGGVTVPMGLSLGVTACVDKSVQFFDTFVAQAEVALEWAMADGGDQAVLFDRGRFVGSGTGLAKRVLDSDEALLQSGASGEPGATSDIDSKSVRSPNEDTAGRRREDDRDHPHR